MKIEDHRLRAFCLVVELQSFSKAAAAKYMTQSAMSHLIRSLEQDLGVKLLMRETRLVVPTPAGKILYSHAQEILRHYRAIDEDICSLTTKMQGELRIVSTRLIANNVLPEILFSFTKAYPDISMDVALEKSEQVIETLSAGRADVGFFEGIVRGLPPQAEKIIQDEIVLIASDSHPLARQKLITEELLAEQTFLFHDVGSGIRECSDALLRSLGMSPDKFRVAMTIADPLLLLKMVQAGVGIAFVSKASALPALQNGSIVPLRISKKKLMRNIYIMTNSGSSLAARTFKKFVRDFRFFPAT
jgi:DNA-binding transcriptional LysR family regulator